MTGSHDRLELLARSGSADERALLQQAAPPELPESARALILEQIERRLRAGTRPRRIRAAVALAVMLGAGSALAYGVARLATVPAPPGPRSGATTPRPPSPTIQAPPAVTPPLPAPEPSGAGRPARPSRRTASTAAPRASARPAGAPAGAPGPNLAIVERPPPSPVPGLVVRRPGRGDVTLALADGRMAGRAGTTVVDFHLSGGRLTGNLGSHPVLLTIHDRRAEGTVGGRPIRFELADISGGHALRAVSVGLNPLFAPNTLLEVTSTRLWWRSACGQALAARGPGNYQGSCGAEGPVTVTLPRGWWELPAMPRMIVLSLLVSGR